MDKLLVSQEYWDNSYETLDINMDISTDPVAGFIRDTLKKYGKANEVVLEVGCYPGRYLKVFGEFGYQLNGIDLTPKVETELPLFLAAQGYNTGLFKQVDFFDTTLQTQYDVVCSFGFLEHFINWKAVLLRHYQMVKTGGLLLLTVPNFKGIFQFLLHHTFDKVNLKRHNTKAMEINKWINIFENSTDNCEILYAGHFGNFDFWTDHQNLHPIKQKVLNLVLAAKDIIKKKNIPNSSHYSPYMGIVIRKK